MGGGYEQGRGRPTGEELGRTPEAPSQAEESSPGQQPTHHRVELKARHLVRPRGQLAWIEQECLPGAALDSGILTTTFESGLSLF